MTPHFSRPTRVWISNALACTVLACIAAPTCMTAGTSAVEIDPTVAKAEADRIEVIRQATHASTHVFGPDGGGGGSGVVISPDGFALTNFHVAQPSGSHMKCSMPDGEMYDAVVVGVDPTGDVALIKLLGRDDFPTATLGDSDALRIGDSCFTVGNPFLLATDFQPSVAYGIVSGVHRYQYPAGTLLEYADCIQTDAAINPGNSGGPLFNDKGEVVGINGRGSFEKRGRVNVGVGYAISSNQIKHFLGYLHSGRIVDHATLGATVATDEDGRVLVSNILDSSDAARRGLQYNDEIISLGGRPIETTNAFKNALGIYPKGWRVPLSFRREGQQYDVQVRLAGVHRQAELIAKVQRERPQSRPQLPRPKPGDGEDKEEHDKPEKQEEDGPDKQEGPDQEKPTGPHAEAKSKLPEHVAKFFKKRRGYSNYYFNELNRKRIWDAFSKQSNFTAETGEWVLTGVDAEGDKFEFILRDEEAFVTLADGPYRLDLNQDMDSQIREYVLPDGRTMLGLPPQQAQLLALSMWRRMLLKQPKQFGDVYYLGTARVPPNSDSADVLVGTYDVLENHFYFSPNSGSLLELDVFPDAQADPIELYFQNFETVAGRTAARRIMLRYNDVEVGQYNVAEMNFGPARDDTKPEKDSEEKDNEDDGKPADGNEDNGNEDNGNEDKDEPADGDDSEESL